MSPMRWADDPDPLGAWVQSRRQRLLPTGPAVRFGAPAASAPARIDSQDARLATARGALADAAGPHPDASEWEALRDSLTELVAYAEERLRVNVGLVAENATLRQRLERGGGAQPAEVAARLTVPVDLDDLLHVLRAAEHRGVSSNQLVRLTNAAAIIRTDAAAERERREDGSG